MKILSSALTKNEEKLPRILGIFAALVASCFAFFRGIQKISITDGFSYLYQAESLLKGQNYIFSNPSDFSHGIIFSAILAFTFTVLGSTNLLLFKLLLSLLFGLTVYLLLRIAQEIGLSALSCTVLALLCITDPFLLFPATDIQTESVTTFIVVYWAYLYIIPARLNAIRKFDGVFFGITGGFAILMRPNFLLPVLGIGVLFYLKWRSENVANHGIKFSMAIIFTILSFYEIFLFRLYSGFVFLANYGGFGAAYLCKADFIPQYLGFASKEQNLQINEWVNVENPLTKIAVSSLTNPSLAEINSKLYRIGIESCLANPIESSWLIILRLFSVWRPSVVFGAYSFEIFALSVLFWVPLTYLTIKFIRGRDYGTAMRRLRVYFLVMGGSFTVSLLLTFPQVRHRVAFAEVFYWLFAVIAIQQLYSKRKMK